MGNMAIPHVLAKIVAFLRTGYPEGVPRTGYFPLLALLPRRLSEDEVVAVAFELGARGMMPIEGTDIRVAVTKITDELPSENDIDRVKRQLKAGGWPIRDWASP
ncbi:MAG: hypothetical protein QOE52_3663 [Mycobacterium sp.]|jgi:hypothetical protein|nr:hypothetical protein [Mycobacterium sp.]MDT7720485.1 hypothetical protein [Mycobacterium sp.]